MQTTKLRARSGGWSKNIKETNSSDKKSLGFTIKRLLRSILKIDSKPIAHREIKPTMQLRTLFSGDVGLVMAMSPALALAEAILGAMPKLYNLVVVNSSSSPSANQLTPSTECQ